MTRNDIVELWKKSGYKVTRNVEKQFVVENNYYSIYFDEGFSTNAGANTHSWFVVTTNMSMNESVLDKVVKTLSVLNDEIRQLNKESDEDEVIDDDIKGYKM